MKNSWYEVNKDGLKKILQDKPKSILLFEPIQNAWDQNTPFVDIECSWINGTAWIKITDGDPEGFKNLADSYTIFAESNKKSDPSKRGRFCVGEKFVLAFCESARIQSTKGGVLFLSDGTRKRINKKMEKGSAVEFIIKMTKTEYEEMCLSIKTLIPPKDIKTTFNGELLKERKIISTFSESLPTVISDEEGNLRSSIRKTVVNIYKVEEGETPHIYEMGIPSVETDDKFHIDVQQKIPLNINRDNVTPSYLKKIRTCVLNNTYNIITDEDANQTWVKEALSDENCNEEAIKKSISLKFGNKVVAFDPSDIESNNLAVSKGYIVVPGKAFSKKEWSNIKRAGVIPPAGKITPSNSSIKCSSDGIKPISWDLLTDNEKGIINFTQGLFKLLNYNVKAEIFDIDNDVLAWYGGWRLCYNKKKLGRSFFEDFPKNLQKVIDLIIHEFGHQYSDNHLSEKYYNGLTNFGSMVVMAALEHPDFFLAYIG